MASFCHGGGHGGILSWRVVTVPRDERREMIDDEGFKKLEKEVNDMKTVMDSQVKKTVVVAKED